MPPRVSLRNVCSLSYSATMNEVVSLKQSRTLHQLNLLRYKVIRVFQQGFFLLTASSTVAGRLSRRIFSTSANRLTRLILHFKRPGSTRCERYLKR